MLGKVIFIGGVHGAGKGTLAKQVSSEIGIQYFTASDLIKEYKKAPVDHQKNVIDAEKNQEYLITAVLDKAANFHELILDGHFTLWSDQTITHIPMVVFRRLPIQAIILVEESPETVAFRLTDRDGSSKSIEQITIALKEERNRARLVQKEIGVPMIEVRSNQYCQVSDWILQLFKP